MKIWHQSLIPRARDSEPYFASLERHLEALARPGTEVVLHGLDERLYEGTDGPAAVAAVALGELLQTEAIVASVLHAERADFDAFAIATLQDPGLEVARTVVNIPVVGYGQAAALIARSLGDCLGVLAFNPQLFPLFRRRLEAYGSDIVGPMFDLGFAYSDIMAAFTSGGLTPAIEEGCRSLIKSGANVIVPGQMLLAELMWQRRIARIDDVPIIDGLGAVIGLAETLATLHRVSGVIPTRQGVLWARPDERLIEAIKAKTGIGIVPRHAE